MAKRRIERGNSKPEAQITLYIPRFSEGRGIIQQARCEAQQCDPGKVEQRYQRRHDVKRDWDGQLLFTRSRTDQISHGAGISRWRHPKPPHR
jgi:hypothetical protein